MQIEKLREANEIRWWCREGMLYELDDWIRSGHVIPTEGDKNCSPLALAAGKGFHSLVMLLLRQTWPQSCLDVALGRAAAGGHLELRSLAQMPLDLVLGVQKAVADPIESVQRDVEQAVAEDVRQRGQRDVPVEGVLAHRLRHAAKDERLGHGRLRGAESEAARQSWHPKLLPRVKSRQPTKWGLT